MEKRRLPGNRVRYASVTGVVLATLLSPTVQAGTGLIDGEHGVLRVSGVLTESACRLEMTSVDQSVDMGDVGTGRLQRIGDRGTAVAVTLRLQDCLLSAANNRDSQGNLTWSTNQPAVSLTFIGVQDDNNPQLFMARGVSGMGLRLTDAARHDVVPGLSGQPQLLTPGNNELTYYIVPERTGAPLQAGAYLAHVNFRLSYE
ncbi:type 1 fimbrial protein [Serratia fonticola]|uniref:fimbrial protein n=1 Tax=Serratia fonticola TaxID=47917 RepID=UPI0015C5CB97|nr:fimbrial protein [Serratia fonticola]MBC3379049.1 type 1 fimbrial protein [Serratia fonticola]NYA38249.1 type 1 fimbrial protein [Serratia fonticola]